MDRMSQNFFIIFSALHSFNGHTGAYLRILHGHDLYLHLWGRSLETYVIVNALIFIWVIQKGHPCQCLISAWYKASHWLIPKETNTTNITIYQLYSNKEKDLVSLQMILFMNVREIEGSYFMCIIYVCFLLMN